ncbi:hypothetical protein Y032_0059g3031 [Ancylostoma ceylanicum]|uniref:Uncharacterized protein n=1 Tax=Ancylostoma ceylanicum TaxID=53326 RepID=A0A016U370_9BILA|nr:hypothetical protein Y032_0059g3031 [Ancylostoma ceylanicum]
MAISDLIQAVQNVTWPEFLQPHVEVLLLWITWAVDYIDLDYLEDCRVGIQMGSSIQSSTLQMRLPSYFL